MKLSDIFAKPVDRPIEGVIKADDEASLRQEVEEYVLTNEVAKRLEHFLDAYNDYQGANGVWISGFFGSGKSHLLKMLALLLENRAVDGSAGSGPLPAQERGRGRPCCAPTCSKAVAIPSKSILFNIDQKADVISKSADRRAAGGLRQGLRRDVRLLRQAGLHRPVRARPGQPRPVRGLQGRPSRQIAGKAWERGREQALLEGQQHRRGLRAGDRRAASRRARASSTSTAPTTRSRSRTSPSRSMPTSSSQGPDFRLNFFVDEVGQYIADNVKLMTNLQTIAESLATKCRGRAWLVVTAQEEMNDGPRRDEPAAGQRLLQDPGALRQPHEADQRRRGRGDPASACWPRTTHAATGLCRTSTTEQQNNFRTLFDFADGSPSLPQLPRPRSISSTAIPSSPTSSRSSSRPSRTCRSTTPSRASTARWASARCWGSSSKWPCASPSTQVGELATFDLMFEGIRSDAQVADPALDPDRRAATWTIPLPSGCSRRSSWSSTSRSSRRRRATSTC